MQRNEIVNGEDFLKLLAREKGNLTQCPLVVQSSFVLIDGEKIGLDALHIEGVTFTETVTIAGFKRLDSMILEQCHFLRGLAIEGNIGRHISILEIDAQWVHIWRCRFESLFLHDIKIGGSLDLSGLELCKGLSLDKVDFSQLELISQHTSNTAKVQQVKTDDPIVAHQFRMIGVPVYMSTEAVRNMITNEVTENSLAA